jgi:hypothetical protein
MECGEFSPLWRGDSSPSNVLMREPQEQDAPPQQGSRIIEHFAIASSSRAATFPCSYWKIEPRGKRE